MKRWLLILALILPFAFPLAAQNVRFDLPIYTTQAQGGNLLPVYAIPGAGIKFYSCSGSTCTTLATTYISATSSTTCPVSPTPMQVTLNGSSTCVSSADPYGNMGGWFQPGQYMATITAQGASYNYYFTVGVGPGGVGCFPNTIANGCTGATTQLGANGTLGIPGPVQNVVNYGAVGDGVLLTATGTDNYSAIQNAINTGLIAKQPVFFPCGIYEISHPLTMYGLTSVPLVGPAGPCALIQYNGGSTAQGVLTIAGSQPATPCTSASCDHTTGQPTCCASYYQQDNLGIVGNSSTPDVLDLLGVGIFDIENSILVGSSTTELFCMSCGPSGHSLNLNLAYNALLAAYGYTPYHTPTHLKVDGYASNAGGNQLVFDGLTSESAGTNGIWITNGANITFSNCQLSGNPVNVQLDGGDNIIFDHGCLLEAGAAAGAVNITTGAVATEFRDASISGLLTVDGSGTTIDGGGYGPITLNSDATSTSIKNVDYSDAISTFVSNEPDVNIDNMYSDSTGAVLPNFPATRFTPQPGLGVTSGVVFLSGLWSTSGAAQKLDPTPLPSAATPWRTVFDGRWITSGGVPGAPTHQEVTDSSPSFTLAGGGTITVSVSGGFLSFSGSSLGGNVIFGGKVAFYPAVTSDSASFAGNVNALAYEVNGSLLSTTNLADWTNSGVANGDVPVWDAGTGQWTPGVNGGFVNPMTTLGDVIYGGTSGAATRLAGQTSSGTECLTQTGTGSASAAPVWGSCAGSAATAFSAITGSTNNSGQAMVVGSTSSLDYSGTGTIDANEVNGAAAAASASFAATNSSRQIIAASASNLGTFMAGLTGCGTTAYAWVPADGQCEALGGSGTVTDGSGTTTTPEFAESTSTAHVIKYVTPTQAISDLGAAPAIGNVTAETTSWTLVANNVYRFTGSGASNATTPATTGATGLISFVNAGSANVTVVTGTPTLVCIPSSCIVPAGASAFINTDGTDQYAIISNANGSALGTAANATAGTTGSDVLQLSSGLVPAGSFPALAGDVTNSSGSLTTTVGALKGVPFCTGYTPTNGQLVQYTTGGSPNPCYTAATGSGGGDTISSPNSTIVVGGTIVATTLDLAGAAGEIMAGATPALAYTPQLGVASSHTGTLALATSGGSGVVTLGAAVGSTTATVTIPDATDTLVNLTGTQTLTNKTLTSPTLTTPALGTPSAMVATNITGIPSTQACVPGSFTAQTDGSTVTWAIASAYCANAQLTFTVHSGSRTLNLTGLVTGGSYVIKLIQDSTGGENLTGGTGCTWKQKGGGGSTFTLTATASAQDILAFTYDGTNCYANLGLAYN